VVDISKYYQIMVSKERIEQTKMVELICMNEQEISQKLDEQGQKIEAIYKSVEKTRKYFLIVMIISIVVVILPAIGLLFAIPSFLGVYSGLGL
jgi:t-SNARE complex subunit (syntaxin)